ncbi:C40 family peptidase [Paenibacillus sp. N1-5-1-14]|uniref:C40 family peptidase n=1 Tax=Paenibacillus radicibacter TaxID=2972488 RepID=UPI002159B453|nr:C40 family peptidase [Paenibacillus radicibacter]MCR8642583.1 C40 family peptidase [Paenibacillus radicibacter]
MKKFVTLVLSLVFVLSFSGGTAFAATSLEKAVGALEGTPYKWAGTTTKGFDCSGFTSYVFNQFDISLSHSSGAQSDEGEKVSKADLRPGDLVFFATGGGRTISHVGIYLGGGEFIHSATNEGVVKNNLSEAYYAKRYITATRVLDDSAFKKIAAAE